VCPSDGAFTFCVHRCQRQAQQHFILNQIDQVQRLADQDRIAVGQRIQPFQLRFVARQVQRAADLDRVPQGSHAALAGQFDFAADRQPERPAPARIGPAGDSTEQLALRKFQSETRKRRHLGPGFPRLPLAAETPGVDFNRLEHGKSTLGASNQHTGTASDRPDRTHPVKH